MILPNYHLERVFYEQNLYTVGAALHAHTSIHSRFEAVVGLAGYMDGACAFSCANVCVFPQIKTENYYDHPFPLSLNVG